MKSFKLFALWSIFLVSCTPMVHQPMKTSRAELGNETAKYSELKNLPTPKEQIVAAVYKFRDQTGQYKMTDNGANWSTAVTQGATSILIRSMEESGWFIPIEREGLPNLLNERKIIRSSRATYGGADASGDLLPPLLYAGVLLEGGIISFDSNTLTGGVGARYLGISTSGQYREDRVTIYLRAVSTVNGKILKTIYTSKTILSQKVDVGVFKFVAPQRILESEAGFTYNEPAEMAVREAIEQAVIGLIIEGIEEGLWATSQLTKQDSLSIERYQLQRANKQITDPFGTISLNRRDRLGLNAATGPYLLKGDYDKTEFNTGLQVGVEIFADKPVSLGMNLMYARLGTESAFESDVIGSSVTANYRFLPKYRATPFLKAGIGFTGEIQNNSVKNVKFDPFANPSLIGSFGVEYLLDDRFGLMLQTTYSSFLNDRFDGVVQGNLNDYSLSVGFGLNYFFDKRKGNE